MISQQKIENLDNSLLEFTDIHGSTTFTRRDSHNGVLQMGGIGSGKTSSAKTFALKYLRAGYGGMVLIAKPTEVDAWVEYCKATGRESDLIIVSPDVPHRFNFLEYESTIKGGAGFTENIFQILQTVIEAGEEKTGRNDDRFWSQALESLIKHCIALNKLAYGRITLQDLHDIAQSAPAPGGERANAQDRNAFNEAMNCAKEYVAGEVSKIMERDYGYSEPQVDFENLIKEIPAMRELEMVKQFFYGSFYTMSSKTRGIITFSLGSFLFRLLQEPVYSLFCNGSSTLTPEDALNGKIILINLPVKTYHRTGQDAQILFKICFQRAMERRNLSENDRSVFIWGDEAHLFLHPHDTEFQATSRSCNVATFYITQNLSNVYMNMGGANAEHRVKSYLGTLSTKLFHSNAHIETNRYASELIGQHWVEDESSNESYGKGFSFGSGKSWKLEHKVRPEEFAVLKSGGPLNDHIVNAYMTLQGKTFHNGNAHLKVSFNQLVN
jgi:hypothetical protein